MSDNLPDWADDTCPGCGEPMVNSEYDKCYSCVPNSRIVRDAAKRAEGLSPREREVQNAIEAQVNQKGHAEIELLDNES